jgi:hypothetical protein
MQPSEQRRTSKGAVELVPVDVVTMHSDASIGDVGAVRRRLEAREDVNAASRELVSLPKEKPVDHIESLDLCLERIFTLSVLWVAKKLLGFRVVHAYPSCLARGFQSPFSFVSLLEYKSSNIFCYPRGTRGMGEISIVQLPHPLHLHELLHTPLSTCTRLESRSLTLSTILAS